MQLAFEQDDARQRIVGRFRLGEEYQGGSGFLHGGIIAMLLDEAMGKAARFHGSTPSRRTCAWSTSVRFRVDAEIVVEGFVTRRDGRSCIMKERFGTRREICSPAARAVRHSSTEYGEKV